MLLIYRVPPTSLPNSQSNYGNMLDFLRQRDPRNKLNSPVQLQVCPLLINLAGSSRGILKEIHQSGLHCAVDRPQCPTCNWTEFRRRRRVAESVSLLLRPQHDEETILSCVII